MAKNEMLTSLAIKEMLIKTLRFHLTPVRMVIIKNTNNNKYLQGCVKKEIYPLLFGMQIHASTMRSSMVVPQKI
jgi:hypothetical protein